MWGSPSMKRSSRLTQLPFGFLPLGQGRDQLGPPVMLLALAIDEHRLAQQGHRLGERLVVVIQPALALAGVLVQRVVLP